MKQPAPRKPAPPWATARYELADVAAVQALNRGEATPDQQRRALEWVVERAAQVGDDAFVPGHPETTQYLIGRQSVGKQVIKLLKLNLSLLRSQKP